MSSKQLLETLHFLAFAVQIGAVMVVSLRLLGAGARVPIGSLSRPALRAAWLGFAGVVTTGVLQFIPLASELLDRPSFRVKIAILSVALVVLVLLQRAIRRHAHAWDAGIPIGTPVRVLAGLSLALWPTVIVVARLMYALVQMSKV